MMGRQLVHHTRHSGPSGQPAQLRPDRVGLTLVGASEQPGQPVALLLLTYATVDSGNKCLRVS